VARVAAGLALFGVRLRERLAPGFDADPVAGRAAPFVVPVAGAALAAVLRTGEPAPPPLAPEVLAAARGRPPVSAPAGCLVVDRAGVPAALLPRVRETVFVLAK
jgi:hypothetical protein